MGKSKKKPFIDKKNASTYHLMHRSQRDVGEDVMQLKDGDTARSDAILWPSPNNTRPETDRAVVFGASGRTTACNGNNNDDEDGVMREWRTKLSKAGLLDCDHERYLKPVSTGGTFVDATTGRTVPLVAADGVGGGGGKSNSNNEIPASENSPFAVSVGEEAVMEVGRQLDCIPLTASCMDEDIAAALFGDFDEGEYEELNDDFVLDAAQEPEQHLSEDGVQEAFDYDRHIQKLLERARREGGDDEENDKDDGSVDRVRSDRAFFSNLKPLHEGRADEDDGDDEDDVHVDGYYDPMSGRCRRRRENDDDWGSATVDTVPGVVPALGPEEERALCEKFEETLAEYDSDEVGDRPEDEEICGPRSLEGDAVVESAINDYLQERRDEIFVQGSCATAFRTNDEGKRTGGSAFSALMGTRMVPAKELKEGETPQEQSAAESVEEILSRARESLQRPPAAPPAEEIFIDNKSYFSEKERNPWDCESILSTYSNLDNNPVTIDSTTTTLRGRRKEKKNEKKINGANNALIASVVHEEEDNEDDPAVRLIRLSNKTGLPVGMHPSDDDDDDEGGGGGGTIVSVNRGEARDRRETREDKRRRKLAVKQERQIARMQKKMAKAIFKEEFQRRAALDAASADEAGGAGGGRSVFRYT